MLGLLGTLAGCTCEAPQDRAGSNVPARCAYDAPLFAPVETDILFVVDDSNSMIEEQEGVARELPSFVQVLQTGAGVQQNLRVGLVNTSVYSAYFGTSLLLTRYAQGGKLRVFPAADGGVGGGELWLTDPDPEIVPRLGAAIRALGINGSFQETPFEAARIALTGTGFWTGLPDGGWTTQADAGNPNAGFLRPGARLLVVAVSDEDDCSEMSHNPPTVVFTTAQGQDFCTLNENQLTPVGDYVTAFTSLDDGKGQGRHREILWGAIAPVARSNKVAQGVPGTLGDGTPIIQNVDCPTSGGPGYRHRAMALAFDPTLTNLDSVCLPDYHDALVSIAQVASIPQTLTLTDNVPDPRLLAVDITREDRSVQRCTLANEGITYVQATSSEPAAVRFQQSCLRRPTDTRVEVKLLCAG
ncbi:MAG TPA: VWA domain-containing protein [Myxococcaceae bacterium]|nr:VWA domain-containing protein [Myxococcaceae bacterium]